MPAGAMVGLSLPVARIASDLFAVPIADSVELSILVGLYFLALAALCWPWTSYALAVRLSLIAAIALIVVGTVNILVRNAGDMQLVPWFIPVGVFCVFAVFWASAFVILSGLVFVRMRYRPVYRPGHCERCGYNLFGLEIARCPECGTQFASKATNRERMCNTT